MRHLLLSEQWFPQIGGSINLFDEIYGRRFPPGELIHVVAADAPGAAEIDASYQHPVSRFDARHFAWMRPESLASYARMVYAASRIVVRDKIDVIHCARVIPEGIVGLMLHRTIGIPYTVWVHGEEVSMYLRYWAKKNLMPEILAEARAVFCNSSFSREKAHTAGARSERLHVVHPCVDHSRFQVPFDTSDLRARFGLEGKTVILSVGRLTRRKGHDHVLQALARLNRKDVVYLVLSDGELEGELHALTKELGLEDTVRFVGPVDSRELPRYYAASDIFVMANRTLPDGDVEGFGLVFLEASASGLPVLAGRSGGVPDAVQDNVSGLLVDGSSVTEITTALERLIDDPELRRRLGRDGRAWAAERFSWDKAAERVREISGVSAPKANPPKRPSASQFAAVSAR